LLNDAITKISPLETDFSLQPKRYIHGTYEPVYTLAISYMLNKT